MNYTVVWKASLLDRLAELYVTVSDEQRQRMADGIERLNAQLADDPFEVGESRAGGLWAAFPPLLCVSFLVDKVRRTVRVAKLFRYGS